MRQLDDDAAVDQEQRGERNDARLLDEKNNLVSTSNEGMRPIADAYEFAFVNGTVWVYGLDDHRLQRVECVPDARVTVPG